MEDIFLSLHKSKYLDVPAIAVNYYAIKSYRNIEDSESLYKFRDLLFKHGKQIGREAEWVLHSILVTCCVARSDLGKKEFLIEAHNVQKKQLEKGFCFARGYFLPMFMDYIAMIALDLGKIEFVEKFIEKYKDHLPPKDKKNVLNYNYSRLAQYKGEHEKALNLISKMKHKDLARGTSIRILMMQIYFDLGMIDPALHLIDSFRHYISGNNKLGDDIKSRAKKMLSITQQLLKIKDGSTRISLDDVKKAAMGNEEIMKRYWLLEKIKELESK
jgi:tetratricopeptide (TPR) repeat protein